MTTGGNRYSEAAPAPRIEPSTGMSMESIQVLRPRLPSAERLLPYLHRIDASRIYSNFGPLAQEMERRMAPLLGVPDGCLISASSGTAALCAAILVTAGRATTNRPYAIVPAYTFVATAVAAEHCGYKTYLSDCDPTQWVLTPDQLLDHPDLDRIGVVIPVAAYGRPIEQAPWMAFSERTGIPVVIDGAACFDLLLGGPTAFAGSIPVALSFHATKAFGVGEGGAVICPDPITARRVLQSLNFGFHTIRDSLCPSLNGKLSEYHAAVGLAELDGWNDKIKAWSRVAADYRRLAAAAGLQGRLYTSPSISSSYALFFCDSEYPCENVQAALREQQIDYRLWYGRGLQHQTHFANCPRSTLGVTELLSRDLLGIPASPDLSSDAVARVVEALCAARVSG